MIIPTGNGNRTADGQLKIYKEDEVLGIWRIRGLKNVRMLHTSDRLPANTEEFVKPLRDANGVWFDGGRQWNLVDSYAGTLTEKEFRKVLDRGGMVGGTSAGATILGDYLVRGANRGPGDRYATGTGTSARVWISQPVPPSISTSIRGTDGMT